MPSPNKRINLTFPDELYQPTKALADAAGMSLAGLITYLIRGASPAFPVMTEVLNKGREYDEQKAMALQSLLSQVISAPVQHGGSECAHAHAQTGAANHDPRPSNTGAKTGKTTKNHLH